MPDAQAKDSVTVRDPFYGTDAKISARLTDRLRGKYACGPTLPNGEPEFGWRSFDTPPIQHEAADRIESQEAEIDRLRSDLEFLFALDSEWKDDPAQLRETFSSLRKEIDRLTEELEGAREALRAMERSCRVKCGPPAENPADVERSRAALSKATGEQ